MNNIETTIDDIKLSLITDQALFSPDKPDQGTLTMLSNIDLKRGEKILDLGCGYGLVGIYAAAKCGPENVWMIDKTGKAVEVSRLNANSNGYDQINILHTDGPELLLETGHKSSFNWILSNPPYHEDFSVARRFIEISFQLLAANGKLVLVVKRLNWYRNKMKTVFGGVRVIESNGYYVLISELRNKSGKTIKPKHNKTTRKHLKKLAKAKKAHHPHQKNGVLSEDH